ncbi:MAG: MBL fold metallo-hydrolase [Phaeospirillum sp.]|nr:MBL fold metallo-hydrolase [Phaeospirillum sp.]
MLVYRSLGTSIHALKLGPLGTNCYMVATPAVSFILDPVDDAEGIAAYCRRNGLAPSFAMLTHAHFDHVAAAAGLIEAGLAETLWYHGADEAELGRCRTYSMLIAKRPITLPPPERTRHFDAGFEARLAEAGFAIRHLPSHTRGSCIVHSLDRRLVFTGDIILNNRVPGVRTAVGENRDGMRAAAAAIAAEFAPRSIIFPGHGKLSLLETEMAYNASIRRLLHGAQ